MPGIETPSPNEQPINAEIAPLTPSGAEKVAFTPADHIDRLDEGEDDAATVQVTPPEIKITESDKPKVAEQPASLGSEATEQQEAPTSQPLAKKVTEVTLSQTAKEIPSKVNQTEGTAVEEDNGKNTSDTKSKDAAAMAPKPDSKHGAEEPAQAEEATDKPPTKKASIKAVENSKENGGDTTMQNDNNEQLPPKAAEAETTHEQSPPKEKEENAAKSTGLRAMGESDRPPDFKAARETLTVNVNEWQLI
jgi:hypothetical protein